MKTTDIIQLARSANYEVRRDVIIDKSRVDYVLESPQARILLLARQSLRPSDLDYAMSIGERWDRKAIVIGTLPEEELLRHAKQMGVCIIHNSEALTDFLGIHSAGQSKNIDLIKELAKLPRGARMLVLIVSAWKELCAVFAIGILVAVGARDFLLPWAEAVLAKLLSP